MADIVILGGGLAGISAAYHLEQKNFFNYCLFEKESTLGGLCGSVVQDGFTFDYTGHLLHINDPYFHKLIAQVVGFDHFNVIHRRSFIYSQQCYTPYPYQMHLHSLPVAVIAECIAGYINRHWHIKKPHNFKAWVLKHFGSGFAKHFFMPYQKKIFAYDLEKITASWTGRFVPSTSLEAIISGIMQPHEEPIGYNAQFFYPKSGGIISWVVAFAQKLTQPISYNHKAVSIDLKYKRIFFANGESEPYKILVNTMPLDHCMSMLDGSSRRNFASAASKLVCNSVLNFNLGINHNALTEKHWIYFPENKYPFYRIGFPHNFSSSVVPAGCSSLYGEIAYINKKAPWKHSILHKAIAEAQQLLQISSDEIITKKIIDISHAYVIYDHWREKNLPKLLAELEQEKIYSIGRYGAWKYCSMQETVLDGKQIAERLVTQPASTWHTHMPQSAQELTV